VAHSPVEGLGRPGTRVPWRLKFCAADRTKTEDREGKRAAEVLLELNEDQHIWSPTSPSSEREREIEITCSLILNRGKKIGKPGVHLAAGFSFGWPH
jgi:hypothetical protein